MVWRSDGRAGLRAAASFDPSAIVLDLKLADVPGQQVLLALKSDPKASGIRVIICSATAFEVTPHKKQLAEAVLGKPFDIDDLILPRLKDGLEVVRRLRADPVTGGISIIAVSTYSKPDYALALGYNDYKGKPNGL